jgi:hypothetical protein
MVNTLYMWSDLRLRSWRFLSIPGRALRDLSGMCPTATSAEEVEQELPHARACRESSRTYAGDHLVDLAIPGRCALLGFSMSEG